MYSLVVQYMYTQRYYIVSLVYLIIYADGHLVTLSTEPSGCNSTCTVQHDNSHSQFIYTVQSLMCACVHNVYMYTLCMYMYMYTLLFMWMALWWPYYFTEPSACQITSSSQPDSERDANRPGVQAATYQRLFPRSNSYPKIVVDFLFLTSGGANSKSLRWILQAGKFPRFGVKSDRVFHYYLVTRMTDWAQTLTGVLFHVRVGSHKVRTLIFAIYQCCGMALKSPARKEKTDIVGKRKPLWLQFRLIMIYDNYITRDLNSVIIVYMW